MQREEIKANQQHQVVSSEEQLGGRNSSSNAATSKQRMRWTPELHEAFVEAVNQLGGSERKLSSSLVPENSISRVLTVNSVTYYSLGFYNCHHRSHA